MNNKRNFEPGCKNSDFNMAKQIIKITFLIAAIGFTLNLAWENLQAPLYKNFVSFQQHFPMCLRASFVDVFIILIFYVILALFHRNFFWIEKIKAIDIAALVLFGILISVWMEKQALLLGHWQYNFNMPLLPIFNVGLTPVLQMAILPLITFYMLRLISRYIA